jgi:hypothetical protein
MLARLQGTNRATFGAMINEQTAWLGVPAINTVGCGRVETHLPHTRRSLLAMALLWPPLLKHLRQAEQAVMASRPVTTRPFHTVCTTSSARWADHYEERAGSGRAH